MKKLLMVAIAILFFAGFSATAKAVSLSTGGSVSPTGADLSGTGVGLFGPVTPIVSLSQGFTGVNKLKQQEFTGTLNQTVYSDSTGMLFEYQFTNDSTSPDPIVVLATTNYTGFTTDVDASDPGIGPAIISSSGDTITFTFEKLQVGDLTIGNGQINPGASSDKLWIQTNAKSYTLGTTQLQDGGVTTVTTYSPATPEPATMLMFGMGALGLVGLRKRKIA